MAFGRPDGLWGMVLGQDGKAMQCFMLTWFNGQCLMREGLWICGLAKFPPNSYVIIPRMHHYTVYESCFDAVMHCTNTLVGHCDYCSFGSTLAALMIMEWIMGRHDPPCGVQKPLCQLP